MSVYNIIREPAISELLSPLLTKGPVSSPIEPAPMIVSVPHAHCLPRGKTHGEKRCDTVAQQSAEYFARSLSKLNGLTSIKLIIADQTRDICENEPCEKALRPEIFCDLNRLRCNDRPFRQSIRQVYRKIPSSILEKRGWLWDIHSFPGGKGHFEDQIQNGEPDVVFLDNIELPSYQSDTLSLSLFLTRLGFDVNVHKGRYNDINNEGLRVYKIPHVFLVEFNESTPKLRRIAIIEAMVLWIALKL